MAHTPGPWNFDRMESAVEYAELTGKPLDAHEGYYRTNDGYWIITHGDRDSEDSGQLCTVTFQGRAKRGQQYNAPDPEGMANARIISAALDLLNAGEGALDALEKLDAGDTKVAKALRAAIAKARGD